MLAALKSLTARISPLRWLYLAAAAGLIFSGWWARGVLEDGRRAHELAAQAKARAVIEQRHGEASRKTEAENARLRTLNRQITAIMERELAKDAYRCPVPADGVRLLNDAAAAANAAR